MRLRISLLGLHVLALFSFSYSQTVTTNGGTADHIPKFSGSTTNSTTIVDSAITESNGNVGINTPNVWMKLHITTATNASDGILLAGSDNHTTLMMPSMCAGCFNPIVQVGDSGLIYHNGSENGAFLIAPWPANTGGIRLDNHGNVAIGTAIPTAPLTVAGSSLGTTLGSTTNMLSLSNGNGNNSFLNVYQLRNNNGADWRTATTRIRQIVDTTGMGYIDFNPPGGDFGLAFGSGVCCGSISPANEFMRITGGGNVGIGTTTPSTALEVSGTISLTRDKGGHIIFQDGTTQSTAWTGSLCGGDYAESVDVSGDRVS